MTRLRVAFGLLVTALALMAPASLAGTNRWTSSGPEGAVVKQLATDPADPAVVYAVTEGGGLFKTTNGGERWQAANDGLPATSMSALVVEPDAPGTLYVAVGGSAIFVTSDAAQHWTLRGRIEGVNINAIAFDPGSRTLYAGTNSGVYTSIDGGETWTGPPSSMGYASVTSIAVSPGGVVYAILTFPSKQVVYGSSDRGQTWNALSDAPGVSEMGFFLFSELLVDENSTLYLMADQTVVASADGAKSWHPLPALSESTRSLLAPGAGHLFASTKHAIFEYTERSGVWSRVTSPFTDGLGSALALSSLTNPKRFYVAATFGIVTTVEGIADWTPVNNGLPGAEVFDIGVVSSEPSVAYAATFPGVFKTENSGQSWRNVLSEPHAGFFGIAFQDRVAVDPSTQGTAYAANSVGILKTSDGGGTWTQVKPNPHSSDVSASALAVAQSNPSTLYAAMADAMYKSTDGGASWQTIMSGLPDYLGGYFYFYGASLAVDPADSATVYLGIGIDRTTSSGGELFKTANGGEPWTVVSSMSSVRALAIQHADPPVVYAARDGGGIVESFDGGTTWTESGLIDKHVLALALSATEPPLLYAGTDDGHVYRSGNGGKDWRGFENGLTRAAISRIAVDSSGSHLYAATTAGVYEYDVIDDNVRIDRVTDDPARLPRLLDRVPISAAFVLPVVGTSTGVEGTLFTTDVTLSNDRDAAQQILVTWLPRGGGLDASSFRMTIPASSAGVTLNDFTERLGVLGIGSIVVLALDESGNLDLTAAIGGSAEIWTHPADGRAPFSQSIPPARASQFSEHVRASAAGLRHDTAFRTNVGIVNLSNEWHQFTILINGGRASGQLTLAVPPLSLVQTAVPNADYGDLSLVVFADAATRWLFYGSAIDNTTEEAHTVVGTTEGD